MHVECGLGYKDVVDTLIKLANTNLNSSWGRQRLILNQYFPPFANIVIWKILFKLYKLWESLPPAKPRTNHRLRRIRVARSFLRWYAMINNFNSRCIISSLRNGFS